MGPQSSPFCGPVVRSRSYFAAEQGLPGTQMGSGPSGSGVMANAVPSNRTKAPSMIFAFIELLSIPPVADCSMDFKRGSMPGRPESNEVMFYKTGIVFPQNELKIYIFEKLFTQTVH